jgi:hypothetical protein
MPRTKGLGAQCLVPEKTIEGIDGIKEGINGIKDTYVVWKYVKKTVFGVGFMGFMGFRHLPGPKSSPTPLRWPMVWNHSPVGGVGVR